MIALNSYIISIIILLLIIPVLLATAEEIDSAKLSMRDDVREKAQRRELTDWLSLQAIAEIEFGQEQQIPYRGKRIKIDELSSTLDLELEFELSEKVGIEVVFEAEDVKSDIDIDETIIKIELEDTEIEFGKMNVPFGKFSSHFISDSVTNFAETKAKSLVLNYQLHDALDLSLFTYKGDVKKVGGSSIDWGIASEYSLNDSLKFGVGYISDLADAQEIELEDNNYEKRVSGLNSFVQYEVGKFLLNAEYIAALNDFQEFEDDRNRQKAWNIELIHFPTEHTEWALRYAGSEELENQPKSQYGISGTWHLNEKVSLTLEYLRNKYQKGLAEDDEERYLKKSNGLLGRLAIAF